MRLRKSSATICLALLFALSHAALAQQQAPQQQQPKYFHSPNAVKLDAPVIVGPDSTELYEPFTKVRLAWQAVPGAGRYLLRIWDKSRLEKAKKEGKEMRPRWETAVREPWVVLYDVPYGSYMYMDQSLYVWEVGAIDAKTNEIGHMSESSFEVSRQYYLKKRELFLRLEYGLAPGFSYDQKGLSQSMGTDFNKSSLSHQARVNVEGWFARHWGADLYAQTNLFSTGQKSISINRYSLGFLNRTYLSADEAGTTLFWRVGVSLQDFPLILPANDQVPEILVSYPQAWGLTGGFRLSTRFSFPLELQMAANVVVPFRTKGLQREASVQACVGGDANFRGLVHLNSTFAYGMGLTFDYARLQYTRETDNVQDAPSISVAMLSYTAQFLTQFHWD